MTTNNFVTRWLPALVVVGAAIVLGLLFREPLRSWFSTSGRTASSAHDGMAMPAMEGSETKQETPASAPASVEHDHAHDDIAYWSCSMHPSVRSEVPGTCPICAMDLTPVTHGEIETGVITVDASRRQTIGVKTDLVRHEHLIKDIRALGTVNVDETRRYDVTLKLDAWIGEVQADFIGKKVEQGEVLFTYYSPDLWAAQEEYLDALRRASGDAARNKRFAEIAEKRLRLLGLDSLAVAAIRERAAPQEYMPYRAPASGTILQKEIVPGSAIGAGELLYRIADLTTVWVESAVYESDLPWLEAGRSAEVTMTDLPDVSFSGRIEFVHPDIDSATRTGRVRLSVPNPDGVLKPGMYANVNLVVPLGERLVVPESSILYAGKSRVAFVDLGEGRLQPRKVKVGVRDGDLIEVTEGLELGETVVTSGNFLIAAESKLKSGIDQW